MPEAIAATGDQAHSLGASASVQPSRSGTAFAIEATAGLHLLLLDLTVPGPQHTKISVFILGTSACCSPWMQWMHEETQHNRGSLAELRPASISTDDPEGPNGSGCVSSGYG